MKRIVVYKKLLAILAAALVLRLVAALAIDVPSDRGEFRYVTIAAHGSPGVRGAPLYPAFLRLVYFIFGSRDNAPVPVIQALAGALVVLPVYAAAARLFDRPAGLVSAGVAAVYPNFALYPAAVEPEWIVVLIGASIAAVCVIDARESRRAALTAALAAIGLLVQPYFLYMIPGLFAVLKRRFVFLAALFALLAPFVVKRSIDAGRFVPVYGAHAYSLNLSVYATGDAERILDAVYSNVNLIHLWNPAREFRIVDGVAVPFALYYIRDYSYLTVLLLGLFALVRRVRREHVAAILPILGAVALHMLFSGVLQFRIRALLEVALILYLGSALRDWGIAVRSRFGGKSSKAA